VLDAGRPGIEDLPLEHAHLLELAQTRRQRPRWNPFERLLELVEADRSRLGGGPEDGERPAAPEEVCRARDLLGQRLTAVTPHGGSDSASPPARARARAPRRESSRDGSASPPARPAGRRRGRRGSAPAGPRP